MTTNVYPNMADILKTNWDEKYILQGIFDCVSLLSGNLWEKDNLGKYMKFSELEFCESIPGNWLDRKWNHMIQSTAALCIWKLQKITVSI